jgi:hypothetical protein
VKYHFQELQLDDDSIDWQAILRGRIGNPLHSGFVGPESEFLVDSGSTECIFDSGLLKPIGIKFENGIPSEAMGFSGKVEVRAFAHTVNLFLEDQIINIQASFVSNLPIAGILGRRGFFEQFKVLFDFPASEPFFEIERRARLRIQV